METKSHPPQRVTGPFKFFLFFLTVIVFFVSISILLYEATMAEVTIDYNGKEVQVRTHADTVEELMNELEIEVDDHDYLSRDMSASIRQGMEITYVPAKEVMVTINGKEKTYYTTADTVKSFLNQENIDVSEHDVVIPFMETSIVNGMDISINRAAKVTINNGGETETLWTTEKYVKDLLDSKNITLQALDEIDPSPKHPIEDGLTIKITRVKKETEVVEERLDYKTITRYDSNMSQGQTRVIQPGEYGVVENHYEITYKNGEEVERELVKQVTKQEGQDEIVAVGTKSSSSIQLLSSKKSSGGGSCGKGEPIKELTMRATAYSAYCNGCSGVTYTGINLRANPDAKVVAVDPSVIPLGSTVWVEGYGCAVAGDTGSAIQGNKIDLFYSNQSKVESFGFRTVRVKVYGN